MKKSVLFTIAKGILIGAFLFFIPPFLLLFFISFMLLSFFFFRRMRGGNFHAYKLAFADSVRSMTDEDYEQFKTNGHHQYQYCQKGTSSTQNK